MSGADLRYEWRRQISRNVTRLKGTPLSRPRRAKGVAHYTDPLVIALSRLGVGQSIEMDRKSAHAALKKWEESEKWLLTGGVFTIVPRPNPTKKSLMSWAVVRKS